MGSVLDYISKVDVPEGESGQYKVERFNVGEEGSFLSSLRHLPGREVLPGEYTRLVRKGSFGVIMSDTEAELRDHFDPVRNAYGACLINGLGLGVVLQACLRKPEVSHITVVEISKDVINLVAPHYYKKFGKDRLDIVHADALEWKPLKGSHYGMVWHDIWPNICVDNWGDMCKLHRKYGRRSDWQGSWCRLELKDIKDQGSRRERYWG